MSSLPLTQSELQSAPLLPSSYFHTPNGTWAVMGTWDKIKGLLFQKNILTRYARREPGMLMASFRKKLLMCKVTAPAQLGL